MNKIIIITIFIEGFLSFFSPCIFPLLPKYRDVLENNNLTKKGNNKIDIYLLKNTLYFVLGIGLTLILFGQSINILSVFFTGNKTLILFISGIFTIIVGFIYLAVNKLSNIYQNKIAFINIRDKNIISIFLLGFTHSFWWLLCIGPFLASTIVMFTTVGNTIIVNLIIIAYLLGFILPFIILSLFNGKFNKLIDLIEKKSEMLIKIGGGIFILLGVFMICNGISGVKKVGKNENYVRNDSYLLEQYDNPNINFLLIDQYGNDHDLNKYKGKVVLLNFFATWSKTCESELLQLQEIYNEYGYNKDDVIILGLATPNIGKEGSKKKIIQFINDNNITFPIVFDESGCMVYEYSTISFPTTFIINKDGKLAGYNPGNINKDTIINLIEETKLETP